MSLVVIWLNEKFAAVACDGRLSRRGDDGRLIPVRENYTKIEVFTETIVVAGTGSEFVWDSLKPALRAFAAQHAGPELFSYLEVAIPLNARALISIGAERFEKPEVALILVGLDEVQGRIRCISWRSDDGLVPVEYGPGAGSFGGNDAVPAASAMLTRLCEAQPNPRLDEVLPEMERIVISVSEQVPDSVGKNVESHLVVAPGKLRDCIMDGTRAAWASVTQKNAAVDGSGNLLLKNVNDVVGSTSSPSTTSSTYAVIPEMTQTLTFKGNKVLLILTCDCSIPIYQCNFAIFKDGVQLSQDYKYGAGTSVFDLTVTLSFIDAPSAGSHTYDVRWNVNSPGSLLALGTARRFQIVELG